jgi:hypothetical protein
VDISTTSINKIAVLDQEFLPLFYVLIHEGPLHDMVGVWCAMSATRFVGHIFF